MTSDDDAPPRNAPASSITRPRELTCARHNEPVQHPRRCPTPPRAERLGAAGNGLSARAKNDRLTCDRRSWRLLLTVTLVNGGGALAVECTTLRQVSLARKVLGAKSRQRLSGLGHHCSINSNDQR